MTGQNKTECVDFGTSSSSKEIIGRLSSVSISVADYVQNLGIIIDSALGLDKQVTSVIKGGF